MGPVKSFDDLTNKCSALRDKYKAFQHNVASHQAFMRAFFNFQMHLQSSPATFTELHSYNEKSETFMEKIDVDISDLAASSDRLKHREPQSSLISFEDLKIFNWEIFVIGQNYKTLFGEFTLGAALNLTPGLKSELRNLITAKIQEDPDYVKMNAREMMDYTDVGIRWVEAYSIEYRFAIFGGIAFGLQYFGFL
jgi:hypothetical protein